MRALILKPESDLIGQCLHSYSGLQLFVSWEQLPEQWVLVSDYGEHEI